MNYAKITYKLTRNRRVSNYDGSKGLLLEPILFLYTMETKMAFICYVKTKQYVITNNGMTIYFSTKNLHGANIFKIYKNI